MYIQEIFGQSNTGWGKVAVSKREPFTRHSPPPPPPPLPSHLPVPMQLTPDQVMVPNSHSSISSSSSSSGVNIADVAHHAMYAPLQPSAYPQTHINEFQHTHASKKKMKRTYAQCQQSQQQPQHPQDLVPEEDMAEFMRMFQKLKIEKVHKPFWELIRTGDFEALRQFDLSKIDAHTVTTENNFQTNAFELAAVNGHLRILRHLFINCNKHRGPDDPENPLLKWNGTCSQKSNQGSLVSLLILLINSKMGPSSPETDIASFLRF
eukprot:TRINITY_DN461_c0_g2_i1.p1 TRINITY_DN461_c0_g2~~TRINITY_DN461_c0_g2_i1.p1  ORF type:complete len:264 (+),score=37.82 TRINITY_DN461_c0_g2_i1:125-916(+)